MGDLMSNLSLGIEDQPLVQSISYPLYQLLPDTILQELLWIHLRNHSVSQVKSTAVLIELHCS